MTVMALKTLIIVLPCLYHLQGLCDTLWHFGYVELLCAGMAVKVFFFFLVFGNFCELLVTLN